MGRKGFSVLEVLVGLLILAIGALAIAGMKITYINGNHFSTELTQATVLAGNKLEELRNLPYDDSKLSNTQLPQQSTESGIVYTVLYNVTDLGNTIKKIEVTVNWTDRVDHKVTLSTLKSNDGMRYGSQR